jgi:hypothetical protein
MLTSGILLRQLVVQDNTDLEGRVAEARTVSLPPNGLAIVDNQSSTPLIFVPVDARG